jgi:branched-chain amino acid aminotransferase
LRAIRRFININGRLQPAEDAAVPADDRSFRYGYGLFETMLVLNGVIRHEALHWERLSGGLALLQFELPARFLDNLRHETRRTIDRHATSDALRIRLQVTPGAGGYYDAATWKPFFLIECWPLPEFSTDLNENGLVLGIAEARKEPGPYSACKSTSALCYAMAARQAKASGWNDALLCNAAGNIVESTIANVFVQSGGRVLTPPLSDGCIDGIMRRVLLKRLHASGTPAFEESISTNFLHSVEGVILTNSLRGIRWVKAVDGLQFNPGFALKSLSLLF